MRENEITERMQAEKELKTSEARLHNIIERNVDSIVIVDRNGIIRFVNPAAESLFGRKTDELIGESFGFPTVEGEITEHDILRKGGELKMHGLGLTTIAEGVETKEQLEFFRLHKCEVIQGYIFSKPLPAEDVSKLLREGRLDPSENRNGKIEYW